MNQKKVGKKVINSEADDVCNALDPEKTLKYFFFVYSHPFAASLVSILFVAPSLGALLLHDAINYFTFNYFLQMNTFSAFN